MGHRSTICGLRTWSRPTAASWWRAPRENEELFRALRGGGGNFGVVTSLEYTRHPVKEVHAGLFFFELAAARRAVLSDRRLPGGAARAGGADAATDPRRRAVHRRDDDAEGPCRELNGAHPSNQRVLHARARRCDGVRLSRCAFRHRHRRHVAFARGQCEERPMGQGLLQRDRAPLGAGRLRQLHGRRRCRRRARQLQGQLEPPRFGQEEARSGQALPHRPEHQSVVAARKGRVLPAGRATSRGQALEPESAAGWNLGARP
jgi:hypothetical protein